MSCFTSADVGSNRSGQVVPALLQRMHDRMCKDPRRRFIIGMTVEDAKLRIWFCNRSELLVSEAVSIMEVRLFSLYAWIIPSLIR